jgi:hypothetical protein
MPFFCIGENIAQRLKPDRRGRRVAERTGRF